MQTYLLLRDNRQLGPFTHEELINKGLKPYDLVWVEGKSAAWRYPGEVTELTPYAPLVEEQPFDRFYKKPEEKLQAEVSGEAEKEKNAPAPEQKPAVASTPVPSGRIYVHIPARYEAVGNADKKEEVPVKAAASLSNPVIPSLPTNTHHPHERYLPHSEPSTPPKTVAEMYPDRTADPIVTSISSNTSSPAEEDFNEKTYFPPVNKTGALQRLLQKPSFVAAALLVITAGAISAILLNNQSGSAPVVTNNLPSVVSHDSVSEAYSGPVPSETDISNTENALKGLEETQAAPVLVSQPEQNNPVPPASIARPKVDLPATAGNNTNTSSTKPNSLPPVISRKEKSETAQDDYAKQELPIDKKEKKTWKYEELPSVTENGVREKTVRNTSHSPVAGSVEKAPAPVKTAAVELGAPSFTKGTMGGLYDIRIPVKNTSQTKLDLVIVDIQYVKANGEILLSKKLSLDHLLPGEQYTLKAPDSNRGVKLNCTVSMVSTGNGISMVN